MNIQVGTLFDCRTEGENIILEKIWEKSEAERTKVVLSETAKPYALNGFGHLALLHNGSPSALNSQKARELLAFLALEEGRPIYKRTAAAALWPGQTEPQAMDCLYKVCHKLKELAAVGEAPGICSARGTLWLDLSQVDCDFITFRNLTGPSASIDELRHAVELYRGPLLMDEGCEWTERMEGFYDMRYLEALERLSDYFSKLGRQEEAAYYGRLLHE